MSRIILVSGKGGVGKTTVAAATALASSRKGRRTLVFSLDLAHSLSDSFDLDRGLFDQNKGLPFGVADNLDVQEIDIQEEIERHWGEIYRYTAMLFTSAGVSDIVAEEVAIVPGMDDVISLMYINQYLKEGTYDTIVVDCPPTSESLRFVGINATLDWYIKKRFKLDRTLLKVARPIASRITDMPIPEDSYFESLKTLFDRLDGIDRILVDPTITTVRLVTNAEKMVIRETQRAYMYFNLYGVTTDQVIVNRLMPEQKGYFSRWAETQKGYAEEIDEFFQPVPTAKLPMFEHEIIGLDRLQKIADALYGDEDPNQFYVKSPPYEFSKNGGVYTLRLRLPFVGKGDVDVSRFGEDVIVRIGSFKRHIPLPRSVARLVTAGASLEQDQLVITFKEA
jgi:arsenite/tail-anchored protein-transporting ATPase